MNETFIVICHLDNGKCDIVDAIARKTLHETNSKKQALQICYEHDFVILAHADGNKLKEAS